MKCEICKKNKVEIEYPYYKTNNPYISICKNCYNKMEG